MTNDEEALEKRLRANTIRLDAGEFEVEVLANTDGPEAADAIAHLRAENERLTRERDEALALNSVNASGANSALDLLESMKTLCEAHMARAEAAERQVATLREALRFLTDQTNGRRS